MSQRLIKSTGPEASRSERGKRGVSRAWEKASRFIDCKALELLPEALLLLHHPHCSIKFLHRGTDTWATVVSRGPPMPDRFFLVSSWTANISLPFWPIKRDISSPPISLNAIRRQTSSTAICVELTNCRHALRCILGGSHCSQSPLLDVAQEEAEIIWIIITLLLRRLLQRRIS